MIFPIAVATIGLAVVAAFVLIVREAMRTVPPPEQPREAAEEMCAAKARLDASTEPDPEPIHSPDECGVTNDGQVVTVTTPTGWCMFRADQAPNYAFAFMDKDGVVSEEYRSPLYDLEPQPYRCVDCVHGMYGQDPEPCHWCRWIQEGRTAQ